MRHCFLVNHNVTWNQKNWWELVCVGPTEKLTKAKEAHQIHRSPCVLRLCGSQRWHCVLVFVFLPLVCVFLALNADVRRGPGGYSAPAEAQAQGLHVLLEADSIWPEVEVEYRY